MNIGTWEIKETEFLPEKVEQNGSRFLIANGFMGYRGTMEEFGEKQLVALNMAGLFDRNGDSWRESVNAPNPFYVKTTVLGTELNVLTADVLSHEQILNIKHGIHKRKTVFGLSGTEVTITAERFLSMKRENIAALKYTVSANKDINLSLETKIDTDIWNIHGDHFTVKNKTENTLELETIENKIPVLVYENIVGANNINEITLKSGEEFSFVKLCGIYWGAKAEGSYSSFKEACALSYDELLLEHKSVWDEIWNNCDVEIEGDDEAQFAIRYSLYHLNSIAPRNTDKCSIPARGLSGQVYKGAAFWDTEMFMMPFFSFTNAQLCKNLAAYRINTIEGAKRKAKEFGYEGAFYAWESHETGDDACTLFNVNDVFTGRPLRTYFKDCQIHVSADVVYGLWEYCTVSGDYSLLFEGGLEMMYQCLYFFYSYAVFKPLKQRFELHNTVGPDEYHERVNNNAFTNRMVQYTADALYNALEYAQANNIDFYNKFCKTHDTSWVKNFKEKLYVPKPDENQIIEQFDGYFKLEDTDLDTLRSREIIKNEYWGGHGLASNTRILKQADVVMLLNVFRNEYSESVKKANWQFYEPYTEHGSSLSACAYGIVAAGIGKQDWAYKYFMKTATVDLTGDTKQYLGDMYIGGTHPAANGGSWNTAVFGFGGVSYTSDTLDISPSLPKQWKSLKFSLLWKGVRLVVSITGEEVKITADKQTNNINVTVNKKEYKFQGDKMKGAIFDLDGVIVDTAKYHYLAWKELAARLGFFFKESDNERLKGVSRMRSLEILLEVGGITATEEEKAAMATEKNKRYVEMLGNLNKSELLEGAEEYLKKLKSEGVLIALGSASKNAPIILEKLGITEYFDAIVDGNSVSKAKPDPEVFLKGAELLGLAPADCVVFEDSQAGIEAARNAGCGVIAVDKGGVLYDADKYVKCLGDLLR